MDTYLSLRSAVQEFLTRSDATTARVDYFIDLTESWLNQRLRVREMETTNGSLTVANGVVTHPADWLEWKHLGFTASGVTYPIRPQTLEQKDTFDDGSTGMPCRYVVRGGETLLSPRPDGTYTYQGTYYQKIPAIGSTQTTNWVLTNYQDVYFFGCLYASSMLFPDDRKAVWESSFSSGIEGILSASKRKHGQQMAMTVTAPVV